MLQRWAKLGSQSLPWWVARSSLRCLWRGQLTFPWSLAPLPLCRARRPRHQRPWKPHRIVSQFLFRRLSASVVPNSFPWAGTVAGKPAWKPSPAYCINLERCYSELISESGHRMVDRYGTLPELQTSFGGLCLQSSNQFGMTWDTAPQ